MSNALGPNGVTDVFEGGGGGGGEGPRGPRGYSAYEIAVQNGFVGTQDQWLESLEGADGAPGADGDSAYEVALSEGFAGTEAEWLASLQGEPGPQGPPGDDTGIPGPAGKSAYEVAVDEGFVGNEAAWLASLQGEDGRSAYQVATDNGFVGSEVEWLTSLEGSDGAPGAPGSPGSPGAPGDSAYQVALDNGFSGTEAQWLASLEGSDGSPGAPGDDGTPGKSAYQSALDTGFVGSEAAWIASLKGDDGDPGPQGDSAYIVAVNNGFVGSEAAWLTSLEGSDGAPGDPGAPGAPGADGDSAYQVAVDNGFVGTESQWLLSLKGADGTSAFLPATVNIPADYATVQAALDAYDAAGGLVTGNAIFTIQLPVAGGGSALTERFVWIEKNYSRVKIKGAAPVSSLVTNLSATAGSVAAGYTITLTVDSAVATAAAAAGWVLVETGLIGSAISHVDKAKLVGYWPVVSTTSTTVTIRMWIQTTNIGQQGNDANTWRCTVFTSVYKLPPTASGTPTKWVYAYRSKCPMLEDIGVVGGALDGGYSAVDGHLGLDIIDSEVRSPIYDGLTNARSCSLAFGAFFWGVCLRHKGFLSGGVAISCCASFGAIHFNGGEANYMPIYATANGKNATTGGLALFGFSIARAGNGAFARPSFIAGNGGYGVQAAEEARYYHPNGAVSGNSSTDVLADSNAHVMLYGSSQLLLGTTSPAINTLGNSNSYIRR